MKIELPEDLDVISTGGGCTAIAKVLDNGASFLVTAESEAPTDDADEIVLGVYSADGSEWVAFEGGVTAGDFLRTWNDDAAGYRLLADIAALAAALDARLRAADAIADRIRDGLKFASRTGTNY